jgi:pyridoxine 5-phosphate synthase
MARLSVNLNKVALLRNSRRTGVPDLLAFPARVKEAGGMGITVHPRPDGRHIRFDDVGALARVIEHWRPSFEYNIEGYPSAAFLDLVASIRPEQCTLVPDPPTAFTSDRGWELTPSQVAELKGPIRRLKADGSRVILFVDPDPEIAARVTSTGADGFEIYTGSYASAQRQGDASSYLTAIRDLGVRALAHGLVVNAGHDLNLKNLPGLLAAIPHLHEASIGHELTADALLMGFGAAVSAYAEALACAG